MEIVNFCDIIAAYMNRDASLFQVGTIDLRLQETNNAKLYAQRKLKFELAKTVVQVSVADNDGGLLSSAVLYSDGVTPVKVRHVNRAALQLADSTLMGADIVSFDTLDQQIKREGEFVRPPAGSVAVESSYRPQLIIEGNNLYFNRVSTSLATSPYTAVLWVYQWMPAYDSITVKTDFFLQECLDWMQWSAIQRLNMYLKEDERIPISSALMNDSWETIRAWNSDLATTIDDLTLD